MDSLSDRRFAELLADVFQLDTVPTPDQRLEEDLGFDSLAMSELWVALEELAGREIDPAATAQLATVGDVAKFIDQQLLPEARD